MKGTLIYQKKLNLRKLFERDFVTRKVRKLRDRLQNEPRGAERSVTVFTG
jgi:hypothetical protein